MIKYGLGKTNDREQNLMLINLCKRKRLVTTNTRIQQERRSIQEKGKEVLHERYPTDYVSVRVPVFPLRSKLKASRTLGSKF